MFNFALATFQNAGTSPEAALVVDNKLYSLSTFDSPAANKSVKQLLMESWSDSLPELQRLASSLHGQDEQSCPSPIDGATLLTPILYPNKLLAVGANYTSHLHEMGLPAEKWDPMPFFSCPPSTSTVGPGKTIKYPNGTAQFDWECELTIVVGKSLRHASVQEAADAIAGYTIGLDLSCRDLLVSGPKGILDIIRGKAQNSMKPCGPYFVPKECLPSDEAEMRDAKVGLWVNDEKMIDGSTAEMVWKPEECLAEISRFVTLEPGDMVMTGSPAGTAKAHGEKWLKVGDRIAASIGGLGVLEVEVCQ
jgi:2,4-diketo-3-deoxy-L-fuconate hydrolase